MTAVRDMTLRQKRELLTSERNRLEYELGREMKGRMVPSQKAVKIGKVLTAVRTALEEIDREQRDMVRLSDMELDDTLRIMAVPVLADVMNSVTAGVDQTLRHHGLSDTIFADYIRDIKRTAVKLVDTLDALPERFCPSDMLIEAVEKKVMSHLRTAFKKTVGGGKPRKTNQTTQAKK